VCYVPIVTYLTMINLAARKTLPSVNCLLNSWPNSLSNPNFARELALLDQKPFFDGNQKRETRSAVCQEVDP
jgi:hypothetical protein